jgi:ABC-type nitrate/sulfonate/bicarbonate transport system permease component
MASMTQQVRPTSARRSPARRGQRAGYVRFLRRPSTLAVISIGSTLVIWTLLSGTVISSMILPTPVKVAEAAVEMAKSGELWTDIWASVRRIFLGYSFASVMAIIVGAIAGRLYVVRGLLLPLLNFVRAISPTALVPVMIIWFGIGESSKVLLVGYTAFITVFFNTLAGVANVSPTRERAAQTLGASPFKVFRLVVFPSAMPDILTGMRVGLGLSFMSVVAAELIAAESGIGFLIMQSRFSLLTDRMFVGLVSLGVLGLLSDWVFRRLIRHFGGAYAGRELTEEGS